MNKRVLYHNHNYVYLLTSNIINRCGDSLDTILFTWLDIYLQTVQGRLLLFLVLIKLLL